MTIGTESKSGVRIRRDRAGDDSLVTGNDRMDHPRPMRLVWRVGTLACVLQRSAIGCCKLVLAHSLRTEPVGASHGCTVGPSATM